MPCLIPVVLLCGLKTLLVTQGFIPSKWKQADRRSSGCPHWVVLTTQRFNQPHLHIQSPFSEALPSSGPPPCLHSFHQSVLHLRAAAEERLTQPSANSQIKTSRSGWNMPGIHLRTSSAAATQKYVTYFHHATSWLMNKKAQSSTRSLAKSSDGETLSFRLIRPCNRSSADALWVSSWQTCIMYLGGRSGEMPVQHSAVWSTRHQSVPAQVSLSSQPNCSLSVFSRLLLVIFNLMLTSLHEEHPQSFGCWPWCECWEYQRSEEDQMKRCEERGGTSL